MERDKGAHLRQEFRSAFSLKDLDVVNALDTELTVDSGEQSFNEANTTAIRSEQTHECDTVETKLPIQVYPALEPVIQKPQNQNQQSTDTLAKIRAPYDLYEKQLSKLHKKLCQAVIPDIHASDEAEANLEPAQTTLYLTPFGILNFEALHERTRKYAAFVLHHTYQVLPTDVDDGLQAGYTHLWKQLNQKTNYLEGKQMAWIGKGIAYKGLHAIRQDWKYQNHTEVREGRTSTDKRGSHSMESRQVDMRIDIQKAITEVANQIMTTEKGKQADHDIWALYGLTILKVSSSELSRLFDVREQSMHAAYNRVRERLQKALPHYALIGEAKRVQQRGPEKLPQQNIEAIQKANQKASDEVYGAVKTRIETVDADTRRIDELALEGIRQNIPISTQARNHQVPQYQMQRAYKRVHLMIGAERDPNVRMLRPEHRTKYVFTLTPENAVAVKALAYTFLVQPKSYEKLVALHAHISNLPISTTAKNFKIPTSTLRYYVKQIGAELMTPLQPAR